jgi:hypothetical protein
LSGELSGSLCVETLRFLPLGCSTRQRARTHVLASRPPCACAMACRGGGHVTYDRVWVGRRGGLRVDEAGTRGTAVNRRRAVLHPVLAVVVRGEGQRGSLTAPPMSRGHARAKLQPLAHLHQIHLKRRHASAGGLHLKSHTHTTQLAL